MVVSGVLLPGDAFGESCLLTGAPHPDDVRAGPEGVETLALTDAYSDDQGVFNRLMVRGLYPVKAHSDDGTVLVGPNGLRIAPLPAERFCSGHLVHVQQASEVRDCISVHATFTEYGDAGKRWRFLESKLWALNEPAYYNEGRYLTFVPPRAPPDPGAWGNAHRWRTAG